MRTDSWQIFHNIYKPNALKEIVKVDIASTIRLTLPNTVWRMSGFADSAKAEFNVDWTKEGDSSADERSLNDGASEDESDSSDEESVESESDKIKPRIATDVDEDIPKVKDNTQLSKKERQEIRKKELDDLDGLLAEFGTVEKPEEPVKEELVSVSDDAGAVDVSKTSNKKKKKKAQGVKAIAPVTADGANINEVAEPVDVAAVLKSRVKKTAKKGDAKSIAIAEALKEKDGASKSGKKKKDKSKTGYSEYSY